MAIRKNIQAYSEIFDLMSLLKKIQEEYQVSEFNLKGVEVCLNGETIPIMSISSIWPESDYFLGDLNCADDSGSFTFIFSRNDAFSKGWDEETGEVCVLKNPVSTLAALRVAKNEFELLQHKEGIIDENEAYREGVISVLEEAYKVARPTNEVVRGNYAGEFAGKVSWSRALDFSVPGMPEVKGLRYIDFTDCTLTRLLMKDGNSKSVHELTKSELGLVRDGLQKALKTRKGVRM